MLQTKTVYAFWIVMPRDLVTDVSEERVVSVFKVELRL
jgi:hypothetical protein